MQHITKDQLKAIGQAMKENGITHAELLAQFPERPKTTSEGLKIAAWIRSHGVRGTEQATSINPPRPSAQANLAQFHANWSRKDKSGKNMPQYYAVEMDGKPHFFRVKPGYKAGIWFVEEQASDELYPVRQGERRGRILGLIFKDEEAARAMYGKLLSRCSRCNRTLTDYDNPYFPLYGPECGGK